MPASRVVDLLSALMKWPRTCAEQRVVVGSKTGTALFPERSKPAMALDLSGLIAMPLPPRSFAHGGPKLRRTSRRGRCKRRALGRSRRGSTQTPIRMTAPSGQYHRGEDHGNHHKTQMENQPFFVQTIEDDRGHEHSTICRLATSPSPCPSRPTSPRAHQRQPRDHPRPGAPGRGCSHRAASAGATAAR